ncbi:hypothetical protein [Brachybacterium sillae]|uniref:oxidoreductase n=1 Tax=Brachybacterium sillae TaxID=2810536 RepID=UPI003D818FB5
MSEFTRVNDAHGKGGKEQLGLSRDDLVPGLRDAIEAVHARGAKFFVQLHHAGVQGVAELDQEGVVVGPSEFDNPLTHAPSRALTTDEVIALVQDFIAATRRAREAGADGIELHGAHGYLINEFLSPRTNHRTDQYGGGFEGRTRFLREILERIRAEVGPDYPITVRLSITESYDLLGMPGVGIEQEEGVRIAQMCEQAGADLISVSTGTYETGITTIEPVNTPRNWRDPLIRAVKDAVSIPVMGTSIVREADQAETMLRDGLVDLVAMGRSWLADPAWGRKAIEGRDADIVRCIA